MDRRSFGKLAGLAAAGALSVDAKAQQTHAEKPKEVTFQLGPEVVLEDADLRVAFDGLSGALVRMERKSTGWIVERRPELGVSFRLFVPLSKRRDNFVLGTRQRAVSLKKISEKQVQMRWSKPRERARRRAANHRCDGHCDADERCVEFRGDGREQFRILCRGDGLSLLRRFHFAHAGHNDGGTSSVGGRSFPRKSLSATL